uniref:DUF4371 domain-containing protein n=1 Tax=Octopus bimaculoides TaxID=37653 RepID=A0A0L8GEV5_OCTBM
MAKRKVDAENRTFQIRWETEYMFTDMDEYNLKRHYETKHQDKYKYLPTEQKQRKLIEKGKDFVAYSLAVDETTDTTDTAQLAIFIRGVDSNLFVMEEILDIKSMHGTRGKDLFEKNMLEYGAPAMCGNKRGLVGRIRLKMQVENCAGELTTYHCIIHRETLCSKAFKIRHVTSTVTQTVNFMRVKGLNHRQFQSFLREIHSEFADVPYHLEVRWLSLGKVLNTVFVVVEEIGQFMDIMLSQVSATVFPKQHFADKLRASRTEFARRFSDFKAQKNNFELLRNLFAVNGETAPCNGTLKAKYDSVGPAQFTCFIPETITQLRLHAARTLFLFGIIYLSEQLFSVMKMNKTSHRNCLTDDHQQPILRVST